MIHQSTTFRFVSLETKKEYDFIWGNARSNGVQPRYWYNIRLMDMVGTGFKQIGSGNDWGTPDADKAISLIQACPSH